MSKHLILPISNIEIWVNISSVLIQVDSAISKRVLKYLGFLNLLILLKIWSKVDLSNILTTNIFSKNYHLIISPVSSMSKLT